MGVRGVTETAGAVALAGVGPAGVRASGAGAFSVVGG